MTESAPKQTYRKLFLALFLPAFGLRLFETASTLRVMEKSAPLLLQCLRGFLSDGVCCLLLAALLYWLTPRLLRPLALLVWCFLLACNREFIAVNSSNLNIDFLTKGDQGNFLRGSVLIPTLFLWAALALLLSFLGASLCRLLPARRRPAAAPAFLLLGTAVLCLWPIDGNLLSWLQANALEENYTLVFRKGSRTQELLLTAEQLTQMREKYAASVLCRQLPRNEETFSFLWSSHWQNIPSNRA